MKIEVLVATVGQSDLSLYEKMNLQGDAVIANQCGEWGYREASFEKGSAKMLSTATKGIGVNRNLALELSKGDVLVFADDDMVYYDGFVESIEKAFRQHPDADMIFFGLDYTKNGEIIDKRRCKPRRVRLWNSFQYGACRLAVKRSSVNKRNIRFSTLFGGGTQYGSGEDTLFIRDCFRKGMRAYAVDLVPGVTEKGSSTWFEGYNEKYVFDKGAMLACAFPKGKQMIKWYFVWRYSSETGFSFRKTLRLLNRGMSAFKEQKPYCVVSTKT